MILRVLSESREMAASENVGVKNTYFFSIQFYWITVLTSANFLYIYPQTYFLSGLQHTIG